MCYRRCRGLGLTETFLFFIETRGVSQSLLQSAPDLQARTKTSCVGAASSEAEIVESFLSQALEVGLCWAQCARALVNIVLWTFC